MIFQNAINDVAASIISEQKAITSLLEEEAAKIQKFIDLKATPTELAQVNESVNQVTQILNQISTALNSKLIAIAPFLNPGE